MPRVFSAWLLRSFRRPVGFLLGLTLLPLALILAATYQANTTLWREQILHNLGVAARLAAEIVDETLTETLRFERLLAEQPDIREGVRHRDSTRLTQRLQEALRFIPRVHSATVVDLQGNVLAAVPEGLQAGRHVAGEEPFLGARQGGWQPYISAVYLREGSEIEKIVSVVWPIVDGDTAIGLLQLQHRVEEVKSWLQKIRVEPRGFLYVVDHRDQLVVFPFQVFPGQPQLVSSWPPVAHPLPPEGSQLMFTNPRDGARWLAGVRPIGATGWRVVAVQPEREALGTLRRVFWSLGLLVLGLLIIVVAVSLRWARLQALSLRLLRQNAKLLRQLQQRRLGGR